MLPGRRKGRETGAAEDLPVLRIDRHDGAQVALLQEVAEDVVADRPDTLGRAVDGDLAWVEYGFERVGQAQSQVVFAVRGVRDAAAR
jgi:hypothetical protein